MVCKECIYKKGWTGLSKGRVISTHSSLVIFDAEGMIIHKDTIATDVKADKGDSGGPLFSIPNENGNCMLLGIVSADAKIHDKTFTCCNKASTIQKELNLTFL